jgi:hypothetical protein
MNLDYFENEGIPAALIFLHGTITGGGTKETIESVLSTKKKNSTRAAVVQITSTEGSLDKAAASSRVQVERFSAEQQNDSMFDGYDDKCEKRVRSSFRLPPLFVGRTEGYNYATAYASYAVAEAQVFKPERDEFDEKVSITLIRALGYLGYEMKSHPLSISDAVIQLKGIELSKDVISPEGRVQAINNVTNLDLQYDEEAARQKEEEERERQEEQAARLEEYRQQAEGPESQQTPPGGGGQGPEQQPPGASNFQPTKKMDMPDIVDLARDYATLLNIRDGKLSPALKKATMEAVRTLGDSDRAMLDYVLATQIYGDLHHDPDGLSDLAHAACDCIED